MAPGAHAEGAGAVGSTYERHRPEETVLYGVVQHELETFLARARSRDRTVPRFGRLLYRLKHRWRDGTTHVVFEPGELVEKLAALVPPPRFHLVRYHGVLGPCASQRGRVVPRPEPPGEATGAPDPDLAAALPPRPRRLAWAELLRRVFALDVLECPRCGARTRLLAAIHPPDATSAILECLDLPARAPPVEAAHPEEDAGDPIFANEGA